MHRRISLSILVLFAGFALCLGQTTPEEIKSDIRNFGNIYIPYPDQSHAIHKAPAGYKPFFITHLGRHGTRNASTVEEYYKPYKTLRTADSLGVLTQTGKELYREITLLYEYSKDHPGQLLPRGEREHRHIIQRMYHNYPDVFKTKKGEHKVVEAYSTQVTRVMMSMFAGMSELHLLNPSLDLRLCSDDSVQHFFKRPGAKKSEQEARYLRDYEKVCDCSAFNARIFTDDSFLGEKKYKLLTQVWRMGASSISTDLGIDVFKYMTVDELYPLWAQRNKYMYQAFGPSVQYGKQVAHDMHFILERMIETADDAIAGKSDLCAAMHYAHDVHVVPMSHLMGIEGCSDVIENLYDIEGIWQDYRITPMGCNIQLIFFRKKNSEDILVKLLFNEEEAKVPVKTDCWPFYHWSDLKPWFESRLEEQK